jgi:hypothetical protein
MALGSTQPLTEMSTRNLDGIRARQARKADNPTAICAPLHGPPGPVKGMALQFYGLFNTLRYLGCIEQCYLLGHKTRRFGGTCRLHLHDWRIRRVDLCSVPASCVFVVSFLDHEHGGNILIRKVGLHNHECENLDPYTQPRTAAEASNKELVRSGGTWGHNDKRSLQACSWASSQQNRSQR